MTLLPTSVILISGAKSYVATFGLAIKKLHTNHNHQPNPLPPSPPKAQHSTAKRSQAKPLPVFFVERRLTSAVKEERDVRILFGLCRVELEPAVLRHPLTEHIGHGLGRVEDGEREGAVVLSHLVNRQILHTTTEEEKE
jgi:hypothetical protein